MKKKILIPIILIAVSAVLAVVSLLVLPDSVTIQLSAGSGENSTAPKALAVLLPSALGIGGAVAALPIKNGESQNNKGLFVSVIGIAVFAIMLIVNAAGM